MWWNLSNQLDSRLFIAKRTVLSRFHCRTRRGGGEENERICVFFVVGVAVATQIRLDITSSSDIFIAYSLNIYL